MAQTPGGRPRAGRGSSAATQQQLKTQLVSALTGATPLPIFGDRLTPLRQAAPSLNPTVTIGGQTYRGADNGRANVLVPMLDPTLSQAELADRRRSIQQANFMAQNPLAGAGYGLASFLNAPQKVREAARAAGGLADVAMSAGAPRIAAVRRPTPGRQGQVADPTWKWGSIRPSELNVSGQAGRLEATATAEMLGTGTKAYWRIRPPGFEGRDAGHSRGHLYPKELGGDGNDPRLLVTLTQNPANHPHMSRFDKVVAGKVKSGEVIEYSATPLYNPGVGPPGMILMTAAGSRGTRMAKIVRNPAGRPK